LFYDRLVMSPPSVQAGSLISRWVAIGAIAAGVLGAIAGLVVGLMVYWPTAWFAAFELGIPASILGGLVGLACGGVAYAIQRGAHWRK
jgi:hypothetical protein